ncbi:MAG: hypothetical protein A2806_00530 [Candidatus Terrybacteria bacterium RIFCSPHIGHO2_01_FULL_48_17]|uniref:Uncharacterized protein n=1 Tax=Candidatus Terrybacteria bacterium RIFCSPHIGHO2_01_FULL_48_17 TaxID=1802362 RepID=A0A1G2PKE9_9BACT|nr:MAG: hypothetical protein A2806_00530 [Candidatus Terrybacteria bacterium RIFCSPHIGHO2_01_FULL_48_17]OHA53830.1 MAG: hypothetical protein A3A30_01125 [Candidatus Terrybacteria bacterium RIFCSPLOWO2_01_FULL_48_14]
MEPGGEQRKNLEREWRISRGLSDIVSIDVRKELGVDRIKIEEFTPFVEGDPQIKSLFERVIAACLRYAEKFDRFWTFRNPELLESLDQQERRTVLGDSDEMRHFADNATRATLSAFARNIRHKDPEFADRIETILNDSDRTKATVTFLDLARQYQNQQERKNQAA